MSNFKKQLLAGPYLIWMIGFILLPLVFILYYAITAADGSFTFSNIAAIADPVHVKSILLSLKLGFLCTLVCLVLSYPLCMILSTFRFRHQSFVVFLFILPMWMNFMLRILAWRLLLSNNGIVNAILEAVGRQGSRREQSDRSRKNHFSAHPLRRVKRNRHGLCAGTDLVRHLRPARWGQGALNRKRH